MDTVNIIKTKDLNVLNPHAELFFPYELLAYKNGKQYSFSIEAHDLNQIPDCKIGDYRIAVKINGKFIMQKYGHKWLYRRISKTDLELIKDLMGAKSDAKS